MAVSAYYFAADSSKATLQKTHTRWRWVAYGVGGCCWLFGLAFRGAVAGTGQESAAAGYGRHRKRGECGCDKPHHRLGLAVVGGLLLSQLLTLYITPVIYVYLDELGEKAKHWRPFSKPNHCARPTGGAAPAPAE
jgi:hypothetical protein